MMIPLDVEGSPARAPAQKLPYAPSWVDRLTDGLARLPGPIWSAYVVAALVANGINAGLAWAVGGYAVGTFYPPHLVATTTGIAYLALIHYLDHMAARALVKFQPALDQERANSDELRYRLATMPAPTVRRLTVAGLLYGALIAYAVYRKWVVPDVVAFVSPATYGWDVLVLITTNLMMILFIYHTVHQLRTINHIYLTYTRIDIFYLTPLYAFAGLSARTALGWLAMTYLWLVSMPAGTTDVVTLVNVTGLALLGLVAFIWPLLGIHRLLEEEKTRHQVAVRRRVQAVMDEIHRRTDARHFEDTVPLTDLMTGLRQELDILAQIPTWPWQPELFRTVLSAVFLPLVLWFISRILERVVAF